MNRNKICTLYNFLRRKQSQKPHQARENDQFHILVEQSSNGILVTDKDWSLLDINNRGAAIFGCNRADLKHHAFAKLVAGADLPKLAMIGKALHAGDSVLCQLNCRRGNGGIFPAELSLRPLTDGRIQIMLRDMTKKGTPQASREASEVRYRTIVEEQTEFICRFKPGLTLTYANPAFCKYFGRSVDHLLGRSFLEHFPEEDHDLIIRQIESLSARHPVAVVERRSRTAYGEERWQQWVNRAIVNEAGNIIEYQSVGRDMTAYKHMEERLKKSESRYRAIIEDQTDLIRRFTPDGTLTFVNNAFCRFYQKDLAEILGTNFEVLIPPEDREDIANQIYSLTPDASTCITEPRYYKPDGTLSWLQYVNRAIFNDKGDIIEYQSVGRDITAQKEAESKLQEAREAVERATRVTTLAIIGGGIAHEINQPLNAVKIRVATLSYLIKAGGEGILDQLTTGIADIGEQIDRIDAIVNHLRLFLRKNQKFEYNLCNLNNIVETSLNLVANQLFSKRIRVKTLLADALPPVCGSCVRFEEVVLNLIMNAVDALEGVEKQRKITLQTWSEEDNVHLIVSDSGRGVSPEVANKMFEPFFSTKELGNNMGLGLSIVHSIVVAGNGTISIENLPAGGTAVSIRLPAAQPDKVQEMRYCNAL